MIKIFVVEDDVSLRNELVHLLELQEYALVASITFENIVKQITEARPDLVILDLKLPGGGGHEVCRDLRKLSDIPLMMLTSSDREFDEVMSMNLGADDYIIKPYNPAILLAHIQSLLRRTQSLDTHSTLTHRGVVLDLARAQVSYEQATAELTRNEVKILNLLMAHRGAIVSRQDLMVDLWQSDAFIDDNTLTVNVNRLRKHLTSLGVPDDFLLTRRAQGYLIKE